jgi:tetratricopeptide (TPR) repeat protein
MPIDVIELWDFSDPAASEARFIEALASASEREALILKTQIARSHGIRQAFPEAKQLLAAIAPQVENSDAEVKAYFQLELGRTHASVTHPPELMTEENISQACRAFEKAFDLAKQAGRDDLAIDALHMLAAVKPSVDEQIEWNQKALEFMGHSHQERAGRWEGTLRNNLGYALHSAGQLEAALEQFKLALASRQREADPEKIRIARWMIAWTLRGMKRHEEALEIQLDLEKEYEQAGAADPYVFEELEHLYQELDKPARAAEYAAKRQVLTTDS